MQPAYDIGFRAAEILLDRIHSKGARHGVTTLLLPATLKVRESSRRNLRRVRSAEVVPLRASS